MGLFACMEIKSQFNSKCCLISSAAQTDNLSIQCQFFPHLKQHFKAVVTSQATAMWLIGTVDN